MIIPWIITYLILLFPLMGWEWCCCGCTLGDLDPAIWVCTSCVNIPLHVTLYGTACGNSPVFTHSNTPVTYDGYVCSCWKATITFTVSSSVWNFDIYLFCFGHWFVSVVYYNNALGSGPGSPSDPYGATITLSGDPAVRPTSATGPLPDQLFSLEGYPLGGGTPCPGTITITE